MKKIWGGGNQVIVSMRGRNIVNGKRKDYNGAPTVQRLEMNNNDESNCLTGVQKDNLVLKIKSNTLKGFDEAGEGDSINLSVPNSKTRRGRVGVGVAQTLDTQANQATFIEGNIRRLTEIECERLQGFPDDWTKYGVYDGVVKPISKTARYKMCGNAVTVAVVELIAKKLLL